MSQVRVELNPRDLTEVRLLLKAYRESGRKALQRSLNHGAKQGRKMAVDDIYSKANLTKKVIRSHTKVYFTSVSKLSAKLTIKGSPLSLLDYKGTRAGKRGVAFRLWRGEARELYRHAFNAKIGRESAIYERNVDADNYDGRFPLRKKRGPSIPNIYEMTPGLARKVEERAAETMMTELKRQIGLIDRGLL
jgi:hypothetical protein